MSGHFVVCIADDSVLYIYDNVDDNYYLNITFVQHSHLDTFSCLLLVYILYLCSLQWFYSLWCMLHNILNSLSSQNAFIIFGGGLGYCG